MQQEILQYRSGIVTFLDILGFEINLRTESAQSIYDMLQTFHHKAVNGPAGLAEKYAKQYDIHILSDCIFKTLDMTHYHEEENAALSVMQEFMFNIVSQGSLFYRHGKLLRGAITYGNFFTDGEKQILFGPAAARAFTLESKYAFYPRIYIDPCVLNVFHNVLLPQYPFGVTEGNVTTGTKDEFLTSFYSWITKGDDGIWFLDYLRTFRLWFPDNENPCSFIRKHKAHIENMLNMPEKDLKDDHLLKYLWLAHYHNETIAKWEESGWQDNLEGFNRDELSVFIPEKYE